MLHTQAHGDGRGTCCVVPVRKTQNKGATTACGWRSGWGQLLGLRSRDRAGDLRERLPCLGLGPVTSRGGPLGGNASSCGLTACASFCVAMTCIRNNSLLYKNSVMEEDLRAWAGGQETWDRKRGRVPKRGGGTQRARPSRKARAQPFSARGSPADQGICPSPRARPLGNRQSRGAVLEVTACHVKTQRTPQSARPSGSATASFTHLLFGQTPGEIDVPEKLIFRGGEHSPYVNFTLPAITWASINLPEALRAES